jgi:hypothetical protein
MISELTHRDQRAINYRATCAAIIASPKQATSKETHLGTI